MSTIEELGFPAPPEEAAPPPAQQEPPHTEVVRDERGRFAPRQELAEGGQDSAEEGRERAPDGYVPVSALQRMREEMRELKQQLEPLKTRRGEEEDNAFYERMTPQQRAEWNYRNDMLNMHEASARAQFGVEAVEEAKRWFQAEGGRDAALAAEIHASAFPYETLVEYFVADLQAQRMIELMQAGFDPLQPDQWALDRARALAAQQQQGPSYQSPSNAPRSIAGIPSAGGSKGTVPVGPGQAFDAVFK